MIIVTYLLYLPLIVAHDHLPIPFESSPCFITLDFNDGCKIVWVPPGLYGDDHSNVGSGLSVDALFHLSLMMILNILRTFDSSSLYLFLVDTVCLSHI